MINLEKHRPMRVSEEDDKAFIVVKVIHRLFASFREEHDLTGVDGQTCIRWFADWLTELSEAEPQTHFITNILTEED